KMPDVRMKWESGSPVSPAPSVSPGSSAIQATVMRGSSGEAVKQLQRLLNAKGFSAGVVDGIFGAGTDAAVKGFQKAKNLVSDGVAGPKTWGALLS
ncbi:MAG: peptidoglycan-binding protein, partial [Defluviitaleaceae bacterium]|nr:peptidoglycan-binding protein [Defluviitaleaceae bacterium]